MRRCVLTLLCLIILATLVAQPSYSQNVVPRDVGFMGMVIRDPHYEWKTNPNNSGGTNEEFYDTMGEHLETLGVRWVRFEMRAEDGIAYDADDPEQGLRLGQYDYFIDEVAPRHNIKVIVLLATNLARDGNYLEPKLIEDPAEEVQSDCWNYKYGCGTNRYMQIWFDRAFAIARRYEGRVAAYEVMNEQNRYLDGGGRGISPLKMATLMTKFYRIFKTGGPDRSYGNWRNDVKIILGGIHPDRCNSCGVGGMNDRQYLNAIYDSTPFQDYHEVNDHYPMDGVGYHPYPMEMRSGLTPEPTGVQDLYRVPARMFAMRKVMLENGDARNKIWVTEIGDRGDPYDQDNQVRQSEFMHMIYWMLWQRRDFVENVLWFKYEDFAVTQGTENWGVVRLVPRTPTDECSTCEYAADGSIEMMKDSFFTYTDIARFGTGLDTHRVFLPMIPQN